MSTPLFSRARNPSRVTVAPSKRPRTTAPHDSGQTDIARSRCPVLTLPAWNSGPNILGHGHEDCKAAAAVVLSDAASGRCRCKAAVASAAGASSSTRKFPGNFTHSLPCPPVCPPAVNCCYQCRKDTRDAQATGRFPRVLNASRQESSRVDHRRRCCSGLGDLRAFAREHLVECSLLGRPGVFHARVLPSTADRATSAHQPRTRDPSS